MDWNSMKAVVERAWEDRSLLDQTETRQAVADVMQGLDEGKLRVAEPLGGGEWQVNEWVKKAVVLYFP